MHKLNASTAHAEGKDWRTDMLPSYFITVQHLMQLHVGLSPALLHLRRELRTKVPQVETQISGVLSAALQFTKVKDQQAKQRAKVYADKRDRARPSDIKSGDKVLLRQARQNMLSTMYDPKPYAVPERKGPSLILQRERRVFMRNVSHARILHQNSCCVERG